MYLLIKKRVWPRLLACKSTWFVVAVPPWPVPACSAVVPEQAPAVVGQSVHMYMSHGSWRHFPRLHRVSPSDHTHTHTNNNTHTHTHTHTRVHKCSTKTQKTQYTLIVHICFILLARVNHHNRALLPQVDQQVRALATPSRSRGCTISCGVCSNTWSQVSSLRPPGLIHRACHLVGPRHSLCRAITCARAHRSTKVDCDDVAVHS